MDDTVTITKTEYDKLLEAKAWLDALEAAGVDNWAGCEYAAELLREDD